MSGSPTSDGLFRFHWRDGKTSEGHGRDAADALTRLGYGNGALPALDYWERVEPEYDIHDDIY